MVLEVIDEYNLPPLIGKRSWWGFGAQKTACMKYDCKRTWKSVLSNCMGVVPHFGDKQFERMFKIKWHIPIVLREANSGLTDFTRETRIGLFLNIPGCVCRDMSVEVLWYHLL
jgi:hypothetical protein